MKKRKIGGLSEMKTVQKSKIRSKPRVEGSEFLELYMLTKERERLHQYNETVTRTKDETEEHLLDVEDKIQELKGNLPIKDNEEEGQPRKSVKVEEEKAPSKEWKTMTMNY